VFSQHAESHKELLKWLSVKIVQNTLLPHQITGLAFRLFVEDVKELTQVGNVSCVHHSKKDAEVHKLDVASLNALLQDGLLEKTQTV